MDTLAGPFLRRLALLTLAALTVGLVGCGPAMRYRPANTMPKGAVEVGAGLAVAAEAGDASFGGAEIQAWVRGGVHSRVEIGGRFWTYSLSSFGGAFDFRAQLISGPIDISLDLSALAGGCCGSGPKSRTLGAGVGLDGGMSIGKRFGGPRGVAFYISPHFQYSWAFPAAQDWPMLLSIPIGVDLPLGPVPLSIRPEFIAVGLFYDGGIVRWRFGGGIGIALQGPTPAQIQERRAAKKAEEEDDLERMRSIYGLGRDEEDEEKAP
jgi:hypothetical protein